MVHFPTIGKNRVKRNNPTWLQNGPTEISSCSMIHQLNNLPRQLDQGDSELSVKNFVHRLPSQGLPLSLLPDHVFRYLPYPERRERSTKRVLPPQLQRKVSALRLGLRQRLHLSRATSGWFLCSFCPKASIGPYPGLPLCEKLTKSTGNRHAEDERVPIFVLGLNFRA